MTWTEIVLTSRHQRVLGVTLLRIKALRCFSHRVHAFQRRLILATFCYVSATFPATYQLRVGHRAAGPTTFWHQGMRLAHVRSRDDGRVTTASCQIGPG